MASIDDYKRALAAQNMKRSGGRSGIQAQVRAQTVQKQRFFYSVVRFQATPSGTDPVVYTIAKGFKAQAFSYGIGDVPTTAGFPAVFGAATEAETNITSRNDTAGATVLIYGISMLPTEMSDSQLVKRVWNDTFCDITLNGTDRYTLLGRMSRIPGAGGLNGHGDSRIIPPNQNASYERNVGVLTNGIASADNFYRLSEPLQWNSVGQQDSKFGIRFETARTITESAAQRAAGTGISAFASPTVVGDVGTFVDVVVNLHCVEFMPRSSQA